MRVERARVRQSPRANTDTDRYHRVAVSTKIKNLSLLLNPLFRKRPMWKHAFELTGKQMAIINELDETYHRKLNDKSMQRAPPRKQPVERRRNEDEEGDSDR